jgi:hypothetical protein
VLVLFPAAARAGIVAAGFGHRRPLVWESLRPEQERKNHSSVPCPAG